MTSTLDGGLVQPTDTTGSDKEALPDSPQKSETLAPITERRLHARRPVRSVLYVDLGDGNGGIVLNLGEGGLALHAVAGLIEDEVPRMRFQLSSSKEWVETSGQVVWSGESRRLVGLKFLNISDAAREKIQKWIVEEAAAGGSTRGPQAPSESDMLGGKRASKPAVEEKTEPQPSAPVAVDFLPPPSGSTPPAAATPLPSSVPGPAGRRQPFVARPLEERPQRQSTAYQPPTPFAAAPPGAVTPPAPPFSTSAARPQLGSKTSLPYSRPFAPSLSVPDDSAHSRRWLLIAVLGFMGGAAMVVASYVGSAGFKSFLGGGKTITSAPQDQQAAGIVDRPGPAFTQFEVVDLDGHDRMIPFREKPVSANSSSRLESPRAGLGSALKPGPPLSGATAPVAVVPRLNSASQANILSSSVIVHPDGSINSTPADSPAPTASPDETTHGKLVHLVNPIYPETAISQDIEGTVKIRATIGRDGTVENLQGISGPDELMDSAMNAVRQWRYEPATIDGQPVEHLEDISIVFRLPQPQH